MNIFQSEHESIVESPLDLAIRDRRLCYNLTHGNPSDPWVVSKYSIHTYQVLLTICLLTIVLLGYINYRVIKIVGTRDKVLVSMLLSLKISLLWFSYFFCVQIALNKGYICGIAAYYFCITGQIIVWPGLFLGIAMTLTFNKWVNFTLILLSVKEKQVNQQQNEDN